MLRMAMPGLFVMVGSHRIWQLVVHGIMYDAALSVKSSPCKSIGLLEKRKHFLYTCEITIFSGIFLFLTVISRVTTLLVDYLTILVLSLTLSICKHLHLCVKGNARQLTICSYVLLFYSDFSYNNLTGPIPSTIGTAPNLKSMQVII